MTSLTATKSISYRSQSLLPVDSDTAGKEKMNDPKNMLGYLYENYDECEKSLAILDPGNGTLSSLFSQRGRRLLKDFGSIDKWLS